MRECKINEYLSVIEEEQDWEIYIDGEKLNKYEYEFYNIPPDIILNTDEYWSADHYYLSRIFFFFFFKILFLSFLFYS